MQLIRCTKKLQKEMGLKSADLVTDEIEESTLGSWHANLLFIDRRKCVLLVNDKTLFNFIIPNVNRKQIHQLDTLFRNFLQCVLAEEDFTEILRENIMQEYESIGFANTNNRSVMGSMNDLAFLYKLHIQDEGGVHNFMLSQIIHRLNHMPMGALEHNYAIESLRSLYGLHNHK